jgi:hypothetical protein
MASLYKARRYCKLLTMIRSTLSNSERTAYTNAVLCLMSKPGKTDQTVVPGAKTRYGTNSQTRYWASLAHILDR